MTEPYLLWSLADDFSINNSNPSPVWSYGYKEDANGSLTLFTQLLADPHDTKVYAWYESNVGWFTPGQWLGVYYNSKATSVNVSYSQIIMFPPHGVGMHPGNDGRFSVARYTAPIDGNYSVTAIFSHIDIDSNATYASTGVYILYNNLNKLFDDIIYGIKGTTFFKSDGSINLKANDTIDFIVGVGPDKTYNYDMTNVNAYIYLSQYCTIECQKYP
ncbi:21875_t:CDS:1, partial [Racocetra persica]